MKIAIVGPDGAGKTSTVDYLQTKIANSRIIYAGKNRNHCLVTTSLALALWNLSIKHAGKRAVRFSRFFIFYPFEYIENIINFGIRDANRTWLFDRHPVDRMIMLHEYIALQCPRYPRQCKKKMEYYLLKALNYFYSRFFLKVDCMFFLLPEADICFERSHGQYANPERAQIKIQAYRRAARQLRNSQRVRELNLRSETTEEIGDLILKEISVTELT